MYAQSPSHQTLLAILSVVFASSLAAGQVPPANDSAQREMDALRSFKSERLRFVKEHYALDAAKSAELAVWMDSLISQQKAYDDLHALTLRRRERVLTSMLSQLTGATEQTKSQIAARMQDQIYAIHAAAPMSLSNVAKKTESILTADLVELGRKVIVNKFPQVFAGGVFNVDRLDRAMIPAVKIGSGADPLAVRAATHLPDANKAAAQAEARSSGAEQLAASKSAHRDVRDDSALVEPAKVPKPAVPTAPPPIEAKPEPPKPLAPAPPIEEWTTQIQSTIATYGFTEEQRRTADTILTSCSTRARICLDSKKVDIEKAGKLSDEAVKERTLRALTKEVDKIYSELTQRIDSLASLEQRQKSGTPKH